MARDNAKRTELALDMTRKILGASPPIQALLTMIQRVASSRTNVLIVGESGTGKELVARMIHDISPARDKPFVPINCGAIPENLIESEMFGHKKGSFTGAVSDKTGLFETAHTGTLFLDEVGELPLALQVKLLRALQEKVIRKVGGNDDIKVDVRVIAATNRNLEEAIAKGSFREDLYYRLNVLLIKTPPLRDRKSDIRLLAEAFLTRFAARNKKPVHTIDDTTIKILESYPWPGNVRELENTMERAVTLESGPAVTPASLPSAMVAKSAAAVTAANKSISSGSTDATKPSELRLPAPNFLSGPLNLDQILGDLERVYLFAALEHAGGVKKKAASLLGITFRSIRYRLKKLGVETAEEPDVELDSEDSD